MSTKAKFYVTLAAAALLVLAVGGWVVRPFTGSRPRWA
jgi:hypothetical protein